MPADKWRAIVTEIKRMHKQGRPVLVGTTSVERSEDLAGLLQEAGVQLLAVACGHVCAASLPVQMWRFMRLQCPFHGWMCNALAYAYRTLLRYCF